MPIYCYQHPKTKEVFEELRPICDMDKPFISPDGVKCERIIPNSMGYFGRSERDREIYEIHSDYLKKCRPKYIELRNGRKVKYNPQKHF